MVGALLDRLERLIAPALRLLRCLRQPVRLLEETIDRARAEERVGVGVVHRHAALLAAAPRGVRPTTEEIQIIELRVVNAVEAANGRRVVARLAPDRVHLPPKFGERELGRELGGCADEGVGQVVEEALVLRPR